MKNTYTIEIHAPPERVFHWINDSKRVMKWLPNLVESEELTRTEGGVGSTFRHVYLENGRRMEMKGEIVAYDPDRRLASEIRGGPFDLYVDYRLEDVGGHTRLTQDSEVRFKGFMKIMGALMKPIFRKASSAQADASFAQLKALAESER